MRLFSCPFCETEEDYGKRAQKKAREDVDRRGGIGAPESDHHVSARHRSHVSQQHRSRKRRDNLADVLRALGAATWRRRRSSMKTATRRSSKLWSGSDQGKSFL